MAVPPMEHLIANRRKASAYDSGLESDSLISLSTLAQNKHTSIPDQTPGCHGTFAKNSAYIMIKFLAQYFEVCF
ncbi:hypothetical protein [Microvirga puerhi]|uniref:Uncharacterized protein n=1 Tax=Microvirga puerhi TaxID=2876078 RepID=A0ABS7VVT5_9HYPH|nr:hypothetical protein [Microvirga puerhi]MBZ6079170.1 hypothetical protein [Microvirga puerhi]